MLRFLTVAFHVGLVPYAGIKISVKQNASFPLTRKYLVSLGPP